MKDALKSWLEKTGYPLELYAYQCAVSRNYICEKSQIYKDLDTGTAREIDLVAFLNSDVDKRDYFHEVQLLIECKKSEKPLIVLSSETYPNERFKHLLGYETIGSSRYIDNGATYFNLSDLSSEECVNTLGKFAEKTFAGYSIVQGFTNSDENIYKGIMGLAKATEFYRNEYHELVTKLQESKDTNFHQHWFRMQLPILLVDAPLFNARLESDGELEIEDTQWSSVLLRMPWVVGRKDSERLLNVQIVKREFFGEFLDNVNCFHRYVLENDSVYFKL